MTSLYWFGAFASFLCAVTLFLIDDSRATFMLLAAFMCRWEVEQC